MEIDTILYKAKDGRIFEDPLKCEEYEKTIGIISGSCADVIRYLEEKHKPSIYVHGLVFVRHPDGSSAIHSCCTVNCSDKMESYVNVKDLTEKQLYITTTVADVIRFLKRCDKDSPVQYMLTFSEDIRMEHPSIMSMSNSKVWDKEEDKK